MKALSFIAFLLLSMSYSYCMAADRIVEKQVSERQGGILVIDSYTESSLWSNDFIDPIYKEFHGQAAHVDIFTEHMNMIAISNEEDLENYKNVLFSRYADFTPKLIVLLGNSAWALLSDEIEQHWPGVPVVLCAEKMYVGPRQAYLAKYAVSANEESDLRQYKGSVPLTVFYTPFHIQETMTLMNRLMPQMKELFFLSDKRYISAQCRKEVDELVKSEYPGINVKHLVAGDMTNDGLIDSLRNLSSGAGVLFFSWIQRETQADNIILTSNVSRILSNYSNVPIFILDNEGLEQNGLVGGCFWTDKKIEETLIPLIKDKLSGRYAKEVQIVDWGTPPPSINYLDFIESGLSLDLCPDSTEFYMKPPTFWESYWYIPVIILFLVLFFFVYTGWLKKIAKERGRQLELMTNYSSLFENMPIMYMKEKLLYDDRGRIVDFIFTEMNLAYVNKFASRDVLVGKKYSELNSKDLKHLMDMYNMTVAVKKELTFQYYYAPTELYLTIIIVCSKQEGYVDVFGVDNTQLSLTQQKLRSANHKLAAALEVASIVPWKWDIEKGVILCDVNKPVELSQEGTSVSEEQLSVPDHLYFAKICKQDRERVKASYKKLIEGEVSKIKEEYRIITGSNKTRYEWVEAQAAIDSWDENGNPLTLVGSSLVISQRKRMELDLVKAKEKAEESNRLKSAFLANMSHEIRTPLNAIVGFSGILASTEEAEERDEYVHIIENNNTLLLQLINDILDLSKIEAGTLEFVSGKVDVNALFLEVENSTKMRNKNQLQIIYNQEMPECYISVDKNRLLQVITNLITNALKFTEKGSIQFGYYLKDMDFLYFYVKDTGCGIPTDKCQDIFGRFVKLDSFVQGTGLGLSICQTIVEHLGGQIGVESKLGEGSTFWFTLPYTRVTKPASEQKFSRTIRQIPKEDKLTVLVAEDNESNYRLLESILGHDYHLIHAWDGREAVERFKRENPQIILMDINMPVMDGYEATREIRKLSLDVPIIAVTAFAYASDEQRAMENGFDGYMAKPISAPQLRQQIAAILQKRIILL